MGKILDKYRNLYRLATVKAAPKDYVVKEHVWVAMRYSADMGVEPWEEFENVLRRLSVEDSEMLQVVLKGLNEIVGGLNDGKI